MATPTTGRSGMENGVATESLVGSESPSGSGSVPFVETSDAVYGVPSWVSPLAVAVFVNEPYASASTVIRICAVLSGGNCESPEAGARRF